LAVLHDIWRLSFLQRSVCYDYGVGSSAAFLGPVMRTVSFLFDFSASVNRIMDKVHYSDESNKNSLYLPKSATFPTRCDANLSVIESRSTKAEGMRAKSFSVCV
jgi:hypothetical protein